MQCCLQGCNFTTHDVNTERILCKCTNSECLECEMHIKCYNRLNRIAMRSAFPSGRRKHASVAAHQRTPAVLWGGRFMDMIRPADHRCRCLKGITTPATDGTDVVHIHQYQGPLMLEKVYVRPNGAVHTHQMSECTPPSSPLRKHKHRPKIALNRTVHSTNIDKETRERYEVKPACEVQLALNIPLLPDDFELVEEQFPTLAVSSPVLHIDNSELSATITSLPTSSDPFSMYSHSFMFSHDNKYPEMPTITTSSTQTVNMNETSPTFIGIEMLMCPITLDVFRDPVLITETGDTYERDAIERWRRNHTTDPLTGFELPVCTLIFNRLVYAMIKSTYALPIEHTTCVDSMDAPRELPTLNTICQSVIGAGRGGRGGRGVGEIRRKGRGGRGYAK